MPALTPTQFIQQVFIDELEPLSQKNHYISFSIMATGIEFLGKCLDTSASTWNNRGRSEFNFTEAINRLSPFTKYRPHSALLYDALRCGFSHSFVPKYNLTLSSKNELAHMIMRGGRLNLKCEDFYQDFKGACVEIIAMQFLDPNDKMNKDLIEILGPTFNAQSNNSGGVTQSFSNNPSQNISVPPPINSTGSTR